MSAISIIGTGNMARGLAIRALAGGYTVQLLGKTAQDAETLAADLDPEHTTTAATGDELTGDLVVLAVWYPVTTEIVGQYGAVLASKIVIDISNPVDTETFDGLVTPADSSAAEELAMAMPADTKVVKAFNTTFSGTLVEGQVADQPLDVLIAGDDADAKTQVGRFAEDVGLRPIDVGPLRRARQLEALGFLHMALQPAFGNTYQTTVKLLS